MSFDLSRKNIDPLKDYFGVVMQQGRVQLDADWNTLVEQFKRRLQAGTLDTFGPSVVPRETADGFLISGSPGAPEIGAGRLYVDGLLAENHTETLKWDARLAEISGTAKLSGAQLDAAPSGSADTTAYHAQPYYPDPPTLPETPYLLYLDVWQRDVSYLQDPSLVDSAVGVDTTARQQTVWQVKALGGVGDIDPDTADIDIPGWLQTIHPSSARLSTATGAVSGTDDPCLLPPQAGYKGLENQLYRVQVHTGGGLGNATFKWSRDNAVVATRVSAIPGSNEIVVDSLGRDEATLGLQDGDWVEIIDDHREFLGQPGELRRIRTTNGIDRATRHIMLEGDPLPIGAGPGQFPVDGSQQTDPVRNTRLIRWDQAGVVLQEDETPYTDLDVAGSSGAISIPPAGTRLFLEKGILVDFHLEDVVDAADFAPEFKSGDYWLFAARVNDASIEILDRAPPQGIHHHYAKLAIVNADAITDCRTLWPAQTEGTGCACTVCVSAENHNNGSATIQQAIDQVVAQGGGTVCLDVGEYQIRQPIKLSGRSVTLRGQGWQTLLLARASNPLLEIGGEAMAADITVEHLTAFTSTAKGFNNAISVHNVLGFKLRDCFIANFASGDGTSQGIQFTGVAGLVALQRCNIIAERGIIGPRLEDDFLGTLDFSLHQCQLFCSIQGLHFSALSFHMGPFTISRCQISGAREVGIELTGVVHDNTAVNIEHNLLVNCQHGIRSGLANLRIVGNDLRTRGDGKESGHGISLVEGLDPGDSTDQQIIGNRFSHYRGHAIVVLAGVEKLMVKQNQISSILGAGFTIVGGGSVDYLSLENNQFTDIHGVIPQLKTIFAAVYLQATVRADISNNVFDRVAHARDTTALRAGIIVNNGNHISISGNRLSSVAVANYTGLGSGIMVLGSVGDYAVENNEISRASQTGDNQQANATWIPLYILALSLPDFQLWAENANTNVTRATFTHSLSAANVMAANTAKNLDDTPVFSINGQSYALLAERLVSLGAASLKSNAMVSGNQINGLTSLTSPVYAYAANFCGFMNNKVESDNDNSQVVLLGDHVGANNNRLYNQNSNTSLYVQARKYAVMGNMSQAGILVNSGSGDTPLPEPWASLNISL